MFRRKQKDEGAANRLRDEAEPNTLSWVAEDGVEAESDKGDELEDDFDDEIDEDKEDPESRPGGRPSLRPNSSVRPRSSG